MSAGRPPSPRPAFDGGLPGHGKREIPQVEARAGLLVEVATGSFVGAVVACTPREVVLEDRRGRQRRFTRTPGAFLVDDVRVALIPVPEADPTPTAEPAVTASGSLQVPTAPARTAVGSRLLVEGIHDAELVEQVWGDDLRVEGVVVEVLHGADDLADVVAAFCPGPDRRLGILLDHLVTGTKESRLAAPVRRAPHVLVTGHPYVDIWQAVRPAVLGIPAWPTVPHGEPWKQGVAERLGFADHGELWRRIRTSVRTWRDLEQPLIRAVEELIDFVTAPPQAR